jgi:hypothetical protein
MATKRRKKKKSAKRAIKPRDPAWRLRRALGARTEQSVKAYQRAAERRAARRVDDSGDGDG